jgi:hypothetical protein
MIGDETQCPDAVAPFGAASKAAKPGEAEDTRYDAERNCAAVMQLEPARNEKTSGYQQVLFVPV